MVVVSGCARNFSPKISVTATVTLNSASPNAPQNHPKILKKLNKNAYFAR
jgi:hypothetical protein